MKEKQITIQRKEFSLEISIQKGKDTQQNEENSASKNNKNHSSSIKKLKIPPSLTATYLSDDHYIIINF